MKKHERHEEAGKKMVYKCSWRNVKKREEISKWSITQRRALGWSTGVYLT
jgi:hypothetical protein